MRFLVTGATGFIGGHLAKRLVSDGHAVTALVRSPAKAARLRELSVTLLSGDLSRFADPDLVLPVPGPLLWAAATVSSAIAPRLGLRNQLDHKQVAQMRAPRFECTSAALTRDLGWTARVTFVDAIRRAADRYRALGWL